MKSMGLISPAELLSASRRADMVTVNVSLRGSAARDYLSICTRFDKKHADEFVEWLLVSSDPDLICFREGTHFVIGRSSERGFFLPDW